jgi:hypothetical protein
MTLKSGTMSAGTNIRWWAASDSEAQPNCKKSCDRILAFGREIFPAARSFQQPHELMVMMTTRTDMDARHT